MRTPDYDHPITITPCKGRVTVRCHGTIVAQSDHALLLEEARYAPVIYIPRSGIRLEHYLRSDFTTHCSYKGDASYFYLDVNGLRSKNAAWSYEHAYPTVAPIRGHVAFHPDKVTFETELGSFTDEQTRHGGHRH